MTFRQRVTTKRIVWAALKLAAILPILYIHPSQASAAPTCLATGFLPDKTTPTLPFYQPFVQPANAPALFKNAPSYAGGANPFKMADNQFTLYNGFNNQAPLLGVSSWWSGNFSGIPYRGADGNLMQAATADSYAHTTMADQGNLVGMWLNSMDTDTHLAQQAGSGSLNMGCWYNTAPYASLFLDPTATVDVSFQASVFKDSTTGPDAHGQAYFDMIVRDRTCHARYPNDGCGLNLTLDFYTPAHTDATPDGSYALYQNIFPDTTGEASTPMLIAQSGIDRPSWFQKAPDSAGFQKAPFLLKNFHIQITPGGFSSFISSAKTQWPSLQHLSTNPADYDILTINVIAEGYDPCRVSNSAASIAAANAGTACPQHVQMGMAITNFKLSPSVPHQPAGPVSSFNSWASIAFVNTKHLINTMSWNPGTASYMAPVAVGTALSATNKAEAYKWGDAPRVLYLDANKHIHESYYVGGKWYDWNMSGTLQAASDPAVTLDNTNVPHVVFQSTDGHIHEFTPVSNQWVHRDITALTNAPAAAAGGAPTVTFAQNAVRLDYRTTTNHVVELFYYQNKWNAYDITAPSGAALANSDITSFVDNLGQQEVLFKNLDGNIATIHLSNNGQWLYRVVTLKPTGSIHGFAGAQSYLTYRDSNQHVHVITGTTNTGWADSDLFNVDGAVTATADPIGFTDANNLSHIIFMGTDGKYHGYLLQGQTWYFRDL